ncbi:MAG: cohesin domain-containing protein [bacterium]
MRKPFITIAVLLAILSGSPKAEAAGASLYFSPGAGSFFVGSTFDVSIFLNTGTDNINAVQVQVGFDPKKIQVASPTAGKSFIEVWVSQPMFSNSEGTMEFIGGVPNPGINTSSGLVSTVTFRIIAPGETTIRFLDDSKVLRNDSYGTDILTSKGRGVYQLLIPPPEGPKIFSPTHPDQNKWYKNNNPTFSWETEEEITDFSYSFDNDPGGVPDNVSDGNFSSVSYSDIEGGIWYFHVKAKKAEIWGGTSHYSVQIDASPPAAFIPTIEPGAETSEKQPLIFFTTTDALSGLDYYTFKYIDITKDRQSDEAGFFQEVVSPYKMSVLAPGKYVIVVRAYDVAGNWREATANLEIFERKIFFTWIGVYFGKFLFAWWWIILILILIALFVLQIILRRNRRRIIENREKLARIEKNIENGKKQVTPQGWQSNDENL